MGWVSGELVKTTFWMMINFISSVWIIWATKICFNEGFKFATALTALHFFLTYLGLEISACLSFFERKRLPFLGVVPLSIAFCCFIVFNNLSLQFNTIGIYQVTKVLTTPLIVLIHMIFYKRYLSSKETLALMLVCVGVVIATETNLQLNAAGVVTGLLGVISSSIYQIWVETKQHDFKCSPAQLLYYQAPISCLLLIPVIFMTESVPDIVGFKLTFTCSMAIFGSALLAFLVNLSTYIVIGATSPVTYSMIGHSKLVVIILSSYMFFGERQSLIGIFGVGSAVVGIISYAHIRMMAQLETQKERNAEAFAQEVETTPLIRLSSQDTV
jgi:solute carrier family 35 protein E3